MKTKLKSRKTTVETSSRRLYFEDKTQEEGITLVALIITIIVLIILAAVTIFAFTESGLLKTASKGTENYANAQEYEKQIMNDIDEKAKDVVKNITDIAGGNGGTGTNPGEEENPPTPPEPELPKGWDSTKVYAYKSEDNIDVPIPIGFTVSGIAGEKTVNGGLVIYEIPEAEREEINWTADTNNNKFPDVQENYNQFVWVPVANTSEMFGVDKDGNNLGKLYSFGSSDPTPLNWTETNGVMSWTSSTGYEYCEPDVVTHDNTASYYTSAGIKDKDGNDITTSAQFKTQLQEEFNAMKASIEKYDGFYIGRYETGDLHKNGINAKVIKGNTNLAGLSSSDSTSNWYAMYQKSKGIVEGKSSMIWGCQWDAVMKWFLSSEDANTKKYVTNSKGKGNYSTSTIPAGSNDNYKVSNIYDMAGNVYEWTQEKANPNYRSLRRNGQQYKSKQLSSCWSWSLRT